MYEAKVIKDNICLTNRLTTMQITHPRIIHAEFNTHRMFCRNASSSRAIPFKKMLEQVMEDPFIPVYWGKNQPGMKAAEELSREEQETARIQWLVSRKLAVEQAEKLYKLNVHKQIVNRLLEPFGWITVCVTGDADAYSNYFALRCHTDAQPEIRKQAEMALEAYRTSKPNQLEPGDWHLPYTTTDDINIKNENLIKISVGRCARVSYLTQDGLRMPNKDIELHDRLLNSKPVHASPFEHIYRCDPFRRKFYQGWVSYRSMLKGEYTTNYFEGR
jgi:thymidylate synthase ThyX